ncbi:MAG: ABC transporter ATP-binding protein [Promethearchaeota archaeon]
MKKKIIKYVKPYLGMAFIAIILLFAQANFDLALPDYLSDIVNTGIQQGGIENAVPEAIRQSEINRTFLFMDPNNQTIVLNDYSLIEPNSDDFDKYQEKYPLLKNESVYVLKDVDKSEIELLDSIMAKPLLIVYFIEQISENSSKAAELGINLGFDPANLPPGVDLFTLLSLNQTLLNQFNDNFSQFFDTLDDMMASQMAILAVKAEYQILGVDMEQMQRDYIIRVGILMLILTLLSVACTIAVAYLSAKTAAGMARDIRRDVFKKVEDFSNAEFDSFSTASLITRSTNDITQIQMVVFMIIRLVFYAPIIGVGGVIRALDKSSSMWWIIATAVIVMIGMIMIVFTIALPKFKSIQKLIDRLNLVSRENLSGMMVIRAFNMQEFEENRFDKANLDLTRVSLYINRVMVIMMPMMMFVMNILFVGIIWFGAHQVGDGNMLVGDMMAFLQYSMQIVMAFLMMSIMFILLPRASVSANRITEVLNTEATIKDSENPKQFPEPFNGKIEFRNVSFRYPGAEEDALHNITFTALPGQTTALIGATGAGKSTIVNLIPRFYDVTSGSLLVDGVDVRDVSQHELRDKIGYVPQKSNLFSGTIESNLKYADETVDEERLRSALEIAQATEFVFSKPEGMQIEISQGGSNVSGGQKQRLAIARALVKKPPIYLFDDSFSSLDFKTDAALRRAFKENTNQSTLLIVTQRVSTVMNAEQILVIDEGKIVGKGTHKYLMENCETYKEIALSQLSLEELS